MVCIHVQALLTLLRMSILIDKHDEKHASEPCSSFPILFIRWISDFSTNPLRKVTSAKEMYCSWDGRHPKKKKTMGWKSMWGVVSHVAFAINHVNHINHIHFYQISANIRILLLVHETQTPQLKFCWIHMLMVIHNPQSIMLYSRQHSRFAQNSAAKFTKINWKDILCI